MYTYEPLTDMRSLVSRWTNEELTAMVVCVRCSALPHHQYDHQLDTVVSHQDPPAVNGHDNCISMRRSHRTLCRSLSVSRTHTHTATPPPPPPYTARSKSSSYWTSVMVSPPDLSDILCLPSLPLPVLPEGPTWLQAACWAASLVITQTVNPCRTKKRPVVPSHLPQISTPPTSKNKSDFSLVISVKNQKFEPARFYSPAHLSEMTMIMLSHDVKVLNLLHHIHWVLLQNKSSIFLFWSLWTRQSGEITNTNESKSLLYFYQMCGRYANDTVTVSDTNVSSCVCRCNKTSVGFLLTRQLNLFPSGKLSACVSVDASQKVQEKQSFQSQMRSIDTFP